MLTLERRLGSLVLKESEMYLNQNQTSSDFPRDLEVVIDGL
jgi:hypothetical protein